MQHKNNSYNIYARLTSLTGNLSHTKPIQLLRVFVILFIFINPNRSISQVKRIVAIGSSTTAGIGASSKDSCWVSLLNNYYKCRLLVTDSVFNLGVGGSDNYRGMPTRCVQVEQRPTPDKDRNISKACVLLEGLTYPADGVVIVNYPSNNYDSYSIEEVMSSLQTIYDSALAKGNRCFITTTQPRSDGVFNTSIIKRKLSDIKDSIVNRFGTANTLNFWDGMYDPADSSILEKYSFGDFIHFNDAGHRELFERVVAKNILNLPVWYSKPIGSLDKLSSWGNNIDGSGTSPTSFTADYQLFNVVNNPTPTITANWTLSGNNTRLVIGNGSTIVNFIIPAGLKVSIANPPVNNCN